MRDYTYRGWTPNGAGMVYCVDAYSTCDPWDDDCNPTQNVIDMGGRFEVVNDRCAFLYPPGRPEEERIAFRPANMTPWEALPESVKEGLRGRNSKIEDEFV